MSEKNLEFVLNRQIANWGVLFIKLHHYHWYVDGPNFFTLHDKFEELYNEASTYIDELAERLLALKGKPVSTMRQFLELTTISEANGNEATDDMVQDVANNFTTMIEELKEGREIAEQAGDEATADMLLDIQQSLEKHNWMLQAYLK